MKSICLVVVALLAGMAQLEATTTYIAAGQFVVMRSTGQVDPFTESTDQGVNVIYIGTEFTVMVLSYRHVLSGGKITRAFFELSQSGQWDFDPLMLVKYPGTGIVTYGDPQKTEVQTGMAGNRAVTVLRVPIQSLDEIRVARGTAVARVTFTYWGERDIVDFEIPDDFWTEVQRLIAEVGD